MAAVMPNINNAERTKKGNPLLMKQIGDVTSHELFSKNPAALSALRYDQAQPGTGRLGFVDEGGEFNVTFESMRDFQEAASDALAELQAGTHWSQQTAPNPFANLVSLEQQGKAPVPEQEWEQEWFYDPGQQYGPGPYVPQTGEATIPPVWGIGDTIGKAVSKISDAFRTGKVAPGLIGGEIAAIKEVVEPFFPDESERVANVVQQMMKGTHWSQQPGNANEGIDPEKLVGSYLRGETEASPYYPPKPSEDFPFSGDPGYFPDDVFMGQPQMGIIDPDTGKYKVGTVPTEDKTSVKEDPPPPPDDDNGNGNGTELTELNQRYQTGLQILNDIDVFGPYSGAGKEAVRKLQGLLRFQEAIPTDELTGIEGMTAKLDPVSSVLQDMLNEIYASHQARRTSEEENEQLLMQKYFENPFQFRMMMEALRNTGQTGGTGASGSLFGLLQSMMNMGMPQMAPPQFQPFSVIGSMSPEERGLYEAGLGQYGFGDPARGGAGAARQVAGYGTPGQQRRSDAQILGLPSYRRDR